MANNSINIQVYRKKWNINIGVIIFGVIFIYLFVTVLMYLTSGHVTPYEVREGSILRDYSYTGFVMRDETVIQTEKEGYINYFALEGSKVGAKTCVYTLSDNTLDLDTDSDDESLTLTAEEQQSILLKTQSYTEGFKEQQFSDVYTLKDNISNILSGKSSQDRQTQLDAMSLEGKDGIQICYAASDGVIIYSIDGYEDITEDTVTEAMISKDDYAVITIKNNTKVSAGTAVYKLIQENDWKIAILLSDENAKEMADMDSVKVRFTKDNETAWADLEIKDRQGEHIAILSFDDSVVRYDDDRYIDIELIMEEEEGLKIPKSSVTEREFYLVPSDYMTLGGNSNSYGLLVDTGKDNPEFQSVSIYYEDSENDMVYVDSSSLSKGTTIYKEDSATTYTLSERSPLQGVYCINKGYAEFRAVNILCESDAYYIIESDDTYGLSNYDHIALDGASVQEDDVVF